MSSVLWKQGLNTRVLGCGSRIETHVFCVVEAGL
jgi:hypothetical protein